MVQFVAHIHDLRTAGKKGHIEYKVLQAIGLIPVLLSTKGATHYKTLTSAQQNTKENNLNQVAFKVLTRFFEAQSTVSI